MGEIKRYEPDVCREGDAFMAQSYLGEWVRYADVQALLSTPPAPSVPEFKVAGRLSGAENFAYVEGWNECRAAMLSAAPSPPTTDAKPRLTKPARVGNTTYGVGVPESEVIVAAQNEAWVQHGESAQPAGDRAQGARIAAFRWHWPTCRDTGPSVWYDGEPNPDDAANPGGAVLELAYTAPPTEQCKVDDENDAALYRALKSALPRPGDNGRAQVHIGTLDRVETQESIDAAIAALGQGGGT